MADPQEEKSGGLAVGDIFPILFAISARGEGAMHMFAAGMAWGKPVVGVVGEKQGAPAGFVWQWKRGQRDQMAAKLASEIY